MKQNLYTCCRCGRERRTSVEDFDAPLGWAVMTYRRDHLQPIEGGERQLECTTLTTHACDVCSSDALAFLEKVTPSSKSVDEAFDDGGAA